ncbi:MAG: M20/M25/M40 family metallo-hydrolase [Acidimicrobiales bacterium]
MTSLDLSIVDQHTTELWGGLVPVLSDYIAIPALSPDFDADWAANGHLDRAVALIESWCRDRPIPDMVVSVHRLEGRTPVVLCEVPATPGAEEVAPVLLYGHLDKQPEMEGWRADLGPWTPVLEGDRLYGRGGADDGYAAFAALGALEAVRAGGGAHPRCVVLIEGSEESGSPDLPAYVEALADTIGTPQLIVCLDSGAADYEHLWLTTSLRGMAAGNVTVRVVEEGLHSGGYGGVVVDGFRLSLACHLLERIEDSADGRVLLEEAWVDVPPETHDALARAAALVGAGRVAEVPWTPGVGPVTGDDALEALLATTWRPQLTVVGQDGLPPTARAGNVLRPETTIRLSPGRPGLLVDPTWHCAAGAGHHLHRPALVSRSPSRPCGGRLGLGRAPDGALARRGPPGRVRSLLRRPGAPVRRRRDDPVHGHARPAVPRHPVPRDRGARARQQRPRAERVPPPAHRPEGDRRGRQRPRCGGPSWVTRALHWIRPRPTRPPVAGCCSGCSTGSNGSATASPIRPCCSSACASG